MTENFPQEQQFERGPKEPTEKEFFDFIENVLNIKEYKVDRKIEDESGVSLIEIEVEDEGVTNLYSFQRNNERVFTVDVCCLDEIPPYGEHIATYEEGDWKQV